MIPGLMNMRAAFLAAFLVLLPAMVAGETLPRPQSPFVNDYANVIADVDENRLRETLKKLKNETGIEMTVLTIDSRKDFAASGSLEDFATALFNDWGIGDAQKNDGILVLVIPKEREMRIALGDAYQRDFDQLAQEIIDEYFLPAFRKDQLSTGIVEGTLATERLIARPFAAGEAAPAIGNPADGRGKDLAKNGKGIWFWAILIAGFFLAFRRSGKEFLTNVAIRFRHCPKCGRRGLHRASQTIEKPTKDTEGQRGIDTYCSYCNYRDHKTVVIPTVGKGSGSSGFGGGHSSGGGASGRW